VGDSIQQTIEGGQQILQHNILKWYEQNKFQLSLSKTHIGIFSNRKRDSYYNVSVNNIRIESKHTLNLLGLTLATAAKANKTIFLMSKMEKVMNVEEALTTYKSIIRPILEYCPSLFLLTAEKTAKP